VTTEITRSVAQLNAVPLEFIHLNGYASTSFAEALRGQARPISRRWPAEAGSDGLVSVSRRTIDQVPDPHAAVGAGQRKE
jgi:hypothetical protein